MGKRSNIRERLPNIQAATKISSEMPQYLEGFIRNLTLKVYHALIKLVKIVVSPTRVTQRLHSNHDIGQLTL
jgi:hypothetical protein